MIPGSWRTCWRQSSACAALLLLWLGSAHGEWPLELEVELDPQQHRLAVVAELEPESRDFLFPLHRSLRIEEARVDGRALKVEARGRDGELNWWRLQLPADGRLRLRYSGQLPALDEALDHRAVVRRLPPMSAEAGSFLPAGAAWYPPPAALYRYRLTLSLPADQRGLVPGELVAEELPASAQQRYRARFEFRHPSRGIDLMAGPWQVRERWQTLAGGEVLRLRTYFPAALDAEEGLAEAYLDDSAAYLARYSAAIGTYPYRQFSVVASPLPTGFGMPTLTYLGEQVLRLPFIRATSLGHEVLHNWWGNGVLVDYDGGNWAEGLTTFMADYAYRSEQSAAAAQQMRLGWLRDFAALPQAAALASFRARTHGAAAAVGYGKAAMLFVMLEDLVGAEAFAEGMRLFWQQQRFRRASWKDLQLALEQASGHELESFFRQWLDTAGAAQVELTRADFVAASTGVGGTLELELQQQGPAHQLRLPLEVDYGDEQARHWIALDAHARQRIELVLERTPKTLRVDPEFRVWRRLDEAELPLILRQWMVAKRPRLLLADGGDAAFATAATALARALCERSPQRIMTLQDGPGQGMQMLIGSTAAVEAVLQARQLELPAALPTHDGARTRVWTQRLPGGAPLLVVTAPEATDLQALLRPLPHYGAQSWLLFSTGRVAARGNWAGESAPFVVNVRSRALE